MHRFTPKLVKAPLTQKLVEGFVRGQAEGTLTAALQMPPQPRVKIAVDLSKRRTWIPLAEVVTPAFEMPVQSLDQLANRLKALSPTDHLPQMLPFACDRLFRRVHAQEALLPSKV